MDGGGGGCTKIKKSCFFNDFLAQDAKARFGTRRTTSYHQDGRWVGVDDEEDEDDDDSQKLLSRVELPTRDWREDEYEEEESDEMEIAEEEQEDDIGFRPRLLFSMRNFHGGALRQAARAPPSRMESEEEEEEEQEEDREARKKRKKKEKKKKKKKREKKRESNKNRTWLKERGNEARMAPSVFG